MRIQVILSVLFFLLVASLAVAPLAHPASLAHSAAQETACPETYCASLTDMISIEVGAALQPALALTSVVQAVAAAVALTQALVVLAAVGKKVPFSLLGLMNHIRALAAAPSRLYPSRSAAFWLPIESISAGRITSKMIRAASAFAPRSRTSI